MKDHNEYIQQFYKDFEVNEGCYIDTKANMLGMAIKQALTQRDEEWMQYIRLSINPYIESMDYVGRDKQHVEEGITASLEGYVNYLQRQRATHLVPKEERTQE